MSNPVKPKTKTGEEKFIIDNAPTDYSLYDFWRWSVSDLLSNATRGKLAEFIVATAIGFDSESVRSEWDDYDLQTRDGIKIEVKSAAYVQSWEQNKPSTISFSIKAGKVRDVVTGKRTSVSVRHADVYVFCLLKHTDKITIDPMKLEQWEFYVVPTNTLNNYGNKQSTIGLNPLRIITNSVAYDQLKEAILKAR